MKLRALSIALIAMVPLSGCTIKSLVNQIEKEYDKIGDLTCDCSPDAASKEQCLELFGTFIDNDSCTIDALQEDAKASRETLNCALDEIKAARKCLEDKLDCDDPSSAQDCLVDTEDCPDLPDSVNEAIAECNNGQ